MLETGGEVITEDAGLKLDSAKLEMMGRARRITITKDNTAIVAESNEACCQKRVANRSVGKWMKLRSSPRQEKSYKSVWRSWLAVLQWSRSARQPSRK